MKDFWFYVNKSLGENECWNWTGNKDKDGYGKFSTYIDDKRIYFRAHRYSYIINFGEIPKGMCVCHKCDNPSCCNPEHLFLGTQQDNVNDMVSKERQARGIKNGFSKLTEKDILEIRNMYNDKSIQIKQISNKFNVDYSTIKNICEGIRWKHIINNCNKINRTNKLNFEKAQQIRKLYKTKEYTHKELSIMFNVTRPTISLIIRNETWKEV